MWAVKKSNNKYNRNLKKIFLDMRELFLYDINIVKLLDYPMIH